MFSPNGAKKFDRCQHKSLDLIEIDREVGGTALRCPRTIYIGPRVEVYAKNASSDSRHFVKIPGTSGENARYNFFYNNITLAREHMRSVAGATACQSCEFYKQSPEQVTQNLQDYTVEKLASAQLERDRLAALTATQNAYDEVEQIRNSIREQYGL